MKDLNNKIIYQIYPKSFKDTTDTLIQKLLLRLMEILWNLNVEIFLLLAILESLFKNFLKTKKLNSLII